MLNGVILYWRFLFLLNCMVCKILYNYNIFVTLNEIINQCIKSVKKLKSSHKQLGYRIYYGTLLRNSSRFWHYFSLSIISKCLGSMDTFWWRKQHIVDNDNINIQTFLNTEWENSNRSVRTGILQLFLYIFHLFLQH